MTSERRTAGKGTLPIIGLFVVIPVVIVVVAVLLDGRPHHQEMAVTALSAGNPLAGIPVRILIDQGAKCDGDGHDLTTDGRGVAALSHVARLGTLEVQMQSVAVCLPDEGAWILAWSSHHGPPPARLSVTCDVTDPSAPSCEASFDN
jgi:hypothetical protein